jgi:hypothetical protein
MTHRRLGGVAVGLSSPRTLRESGSALGTDSTFCWVPGQSLVGDAAAAATPEPPAVRCLAPFGRCRAPDNRCRGTARARRLPQGPSRTHARITLSLRIFSIFLHSSSTQRCSSRPARIIFVISLKVSHCTKCTTRDLLSTARKLDAGTAAASTLLAMDWKQLAVLVQSQVLPAAPSLVVSSATLPPGLSTIRWV